jgi:hypothetical protein
MGAASHSTATSVLHHRRCTQHFADIIVHRLLVMGRVVGGSECAEARKRIASASVSSKALIATFACCTDAAWMAIAA